MDINIRITEGTNRLTLEITGVNWEGCKEGDFYQGELKVQQMVAAIGQELTKERLASKEEEALRIEYEGKVYYKKGDPSVGHYKSLYGDIALARNLYQTARGGETICPMEINCKMSFGSATPRLAEVLAFKVSAMTAREAESDLATCHQLPLSASYILETAQGVGQMAVEKKEAWELRKTGTDDRPIRVIATGMDGATLPIVEEHYKIAMVGTIALYDEMGERLQTEYVGAMPEAGKEGFYGRFDQRVDRLLEQYPEAAHVALCDGERAHWDHIDAQYPEAIDILDFYHASDHLSDAADAIFGAAAAEEKEGWYEYYRTVLKEEKAGVSTVIRELMYQSNHKTYGPERAEALRQAITYFHNNAHRMHYWKYLEWGFPIGSGVTEAGCKELIKTRFCRSGMKWKRESGDTILQLRAIRLSKQWDTFWFKVMRYVA
jgi:hypothetical protein